MSVTPITSRMDERLFENSRWRRLGGRLIAANSVMTLADQVVVSAANFVTTVVLGRAAGPEALGVYAVVFSISVMLLSAQESLCSLPYAIQFRKLPASRRSAYAGSTLVQASLLAMICTIVLVASGLITSISGSQSMSIALLAMGLSTPLVLLRDFARRHSLAHLRSHQALVIDALSTGIQLSLLVLLAARGWLNAGTAVATMGIGAALSGVVWLLASRSQFTLRRRSLRGDLFRNLRVGKWVFASHLCSIINCYSVHWLLAWLLGAGAAGVFVGSTAIVQLASPFILGMHNLLSPRIAEAESESGTRGVRRVLLATTACIATVMVLFCLGIAISGQWLTAAIFGSEFAGYPLTTLLFAVGVCSATIGMPADRVLWVSGHPAASFRTAVVGLVVTVTVTVALVSPLGITAGAVGILIGYLTTAVARWLTIWQLGILSEASS